MTIDIVPLGGSMCMQLHALNNAFAVETSFLGEGEWSELIGRARFAFAAVPDKAFLLAYDRKPMDVSPNYDWFAARYNGFVYVDRIVVTAAARGESLGRRLYERLFEEARAAGFAAITCEINIDPPNPGSLIFHEKLGFSAVGEQTLAHNGKTVRYFLRRL